MKFKQYLSELNTVEQGQAIIAHEPSDEGSSSLSNPKIRAEINYRLSNELKNILSPYSGIQLIRKVLSRFSLNLPALYDIEPEGDEIIETLDQFGIKSEKEYHIYILYYLSDDGTYEFYAEVVDDETLDDIFADDEELDLE